MPIGAYEKLNSGNVFIDALDSGSYWSWNVGEERILNYNLHNWNGATFDGSIIDHNWSDNLADQARQAFAAIEAIIDVKFVEVSTRAEASMAVQFYPTTGAAGWSGMPWAGTAQTETSMSDGFINRASFDVEFQYTLLHELGHALGLDHSFNFPGANGDAWAAGDYNLSTTPYSMMAYSGMRTQISPMVLDIAVLQARYGANTTTAAEDNIYEIRDDGAGQMTSIWDTGGSDELRYNGENNVTINLKAATLKNEAGGGGFFSRISNVGDWETNQFSIANGVIIEKATGGAGNDQIIGNDADNILIGNAGDDKFDAGIGNDKAYGGEGNDNFSASAGKKFFDGGQGSDTIDYSGFEGGINVTLRRNSNAITRGSEVQDDVLRSIESIIGTAFKDRIIGDKSNNSFMGGAGADVLDGGAGRDTLDYSTSEAAVNIQLRGNKRAITSGGDAEGDKATGFENIIGSALDDKLQGDNRNNLIEGGAGADILIGGKGTDTLSYESSSASVNISLNGAEAALASGGDAEGDVATGFENLIGSAKDDLLKGDAGRNVIHGGAGSDEIHGGLGSDILRGEEGDDRIFANNLISNGAFLKHTGTGNWNSWGYTWDGLEDWTVENTGPVYENFNSNLGAPIWSLNNLLGWAVTSGSISQTVKAEAGRSLEINLSAYWNNDTASSIEVFYDGVSIGKYDFTEAEKGKLVDITYRVNSVENGLLKITGTGSSDLHLQNVHVGYWREDGDLLEGDAGNDWLYGSGGNDRVFGDANNDLLYGFGGNDQLYGGEGADHIRGGDDDLIDGGAGADILDGGFGIDTLSYVSSSAGVSVNLQSNSTSGGDAEGDVISGFENVKASRFDDVIIGSNGANVLWGGEGDDYFIGGGGADRFYGGSGRDSLSYVTSSEGVIVNLGRSTALGGDAEGDILKGSSIENLIGSGFDDKLYGNNGSNFLVGGNGNDVLSGGNGNDALKGGTGEDVLIGGKGADRFMWGDGDWGTDTIKDFQDKVDIIDLSTYSDDYDITSDNFADMVGISGNSGKFTVVLFEGDAYQQIINIQATSTRAKLSEADFILDA